MYSKDGLEHGIKMCRKNIKVLEDAIEKERDTIKEYRIMIDDLEKAGALAKEAAANIHIEVDNDS